LNSDGTTTEKIYNVALSNGRQPDPVSGKVGDLPPTVDIEQASYSNSTGAVSFSTVWEDPDFDPAQQAFYYARVIEIATPRWTAYDAKFFKPEAPAEMPLLTRERVYSSPIWYKVAH